MLRILHVGEYVKGGVATYIRTLIKEQHINHEISLLVSDFNSERNWPISTDNIFYYDYKRNIANILKAVTQIYKYIKVVQPDIIHVHSTWAGLFVRVIYFFVSNRPKIVYCAHGWSFLMDVSIVKKCIYAFAEIILAHKTDVIINISQHEQIQSFKFGLPKEKSVMIYNGVDCNISNKKVNQDLGFNYNNAFKLLYVGRFDKQKGIDILIDFFSKCEVKNVELYVIGEKVLNKDKINFPCGIHYLGWKDNSEIDNYYRACDAVIIPSRWEGFGLVAIEAMRNEKAVIASNRGALSEIVINNYSGYVFDLDNLYELDKILKKLSKEKLIYFGKNGNKIFKEKFTSETLNRNIMKLYISLFD